MSKFIGIIVAIFIVSKTTLADEADPVSSTPVDIAKIAGAWCSQTNGEFLLDDTRITIDVAGNITDNFGYQGFRKFVLFDRDNTENLIRLAGEYEAISPHFYSLNLNPDNLFALMSMHTPTDEPLLYALIVYNVVNDRLEYWDAYSLQKTSGDPLIRCHAIPTS